MLYRSSTRTLGAAALAALLALAVFACAPGRDTPLISSEEFGTPTPVPTPTATRLPEEAVEIAGRRTSDAQTALDVVGKDIIKIANWKEGGPAMLNNLLGYLMVWGYDYTVELVEMEQEDYRDAIEKGEVDLVLYVDTADADTATWLSSVVESGTVMKGGKPIADSETVQDCSTPHHVGTGAGPVELSSPPRTLPGEAFRENRWHGPVRACRRDTERRGVQVSEGAGRGLEHVGLGGGGVKGPGGHRREQDVAPQPDVHSAGRRGQRLREELGSRGFPSCPRRETYL